MEKFPSPKCFGELNLTQSGHTGKLGYIEFKLDVSTHLCLRIYPVIGGPIFASYLWATGSSMPGTLVCTLYPSVVIKTDHNQVDVMWQGRPLDEVCGNSHLGCTLVCHVSLFQSACTSCFILCVRVPNAMIFSVYSSICKWDRQHLKLDISWYYFLLRLTFLQMAIVTNNLNGAQCKLLKTSMRTDRLWLSLYNYKSRQLSQIHARLSDWHAYFPGHHSPGSTLQSWFGGKKGGSLGPTMRGRTAI